MLSGQHREYNNSDRATVVVHIAPEAERYGRVNLRVLRPDCVYLGRPLQPGKKCGARLRICKLHEKCTSYTKLDGIACCAECGDYEAP